MWLGSATLTGLLLASSLTVSASSQTATTTTNRFSVKPVFLASSIMPSGTYTEAVRKVIPKVKVETEPAVEKSVPTPSDSVTVVAQKTQQVMPEKTATAQPAKSNTKTLVAATPKQQVSRSDGSALVSNALSLVGIPYLFGGTSRGGFDCSGFTQYVFKGSGISLPRTATEQFRVGSSVKRAQIQAGDLVFFTTYAPGASHVGISIGGGSFVHASNSGVRTSSLNESYYASRFLGARRI